MAAKKTYIPMPKGLQLPENAKEGDTVDLMCECRIEGDKLCVLGVEGSPTDPDEGSEGDENATPSDTGSGSKFADAYQSAMAGGSQ